MPGEKDAMQVEVRRVLFFPVVGNYVLIAEAALGGREPTMLSLCPRCRPLRSIGDAGERLADKDESSCERVKKSSSAS